MSNFNDLDDIFKDDLGDEIDLEGTAFSVDDFEEDLFEEQPQTSINRTFIFAGGSLLATFAVIVATIVAIGSGGPDTDAIGTANAINTQNAATQTSIAITAVAFETQGAVDAADTVTADAAVLLTRDASVSQTQAAIDAQVAATQTSIAAAATQTQGAIETAFALTQTANAPTPLPTVQLGFELRDANGNPVQQGIIIDVYRDDGDRQFNPLPSPTIAPTATSTLTPTINVSVTPTTNPTIIALTLNAEISEFDQRSTARAQQLTQTASAPGATPNAIPTRPSMTPTIEPTTDVESATEEPVTPVAEVITADQATLSGDEQQLANDIFSVRVPIEWTVSYPSPDTIVFSESFEGLDFRSDVVETLDDPTQVGLGGRLTAYLPTDLGATTVDASGMDSFVAQVLAEFETRGTIEILEDPRSVPTLLNANFARVGVVRGQIEEGFVIFLGFDDYFIYGSAMAPVGQFEANRDSLFAIIETIISPPQSEEPVGFAPSNDGNTSFMKISGPVLQPGIFQDDPTPTPPVGGDTEGVPIQIGPNGQGQIVLPGEPGTYFLVLELAPGVYTLFIEGQAIEITVIEGQVTESTVILGERTLIIRTRGLSPNVPTPTLTLSPTVTQGVIADTPISPFLQTATAAARTALPAITETTTLETGTPGTPSSITATPPSGIPNAGLNVSTDATTPEGLAMLAIMGIGLLGVVFVVRRLRSNIE